MSKVKGRAKYLLMLPRSVKAAAQRLAAEDGVSLNQFIAVAIAEKIGAVETAAAILRQRAGDATPEDLLIFVRNAPNVPPVEGDELQKAGVLRRSR
jgi:hypothetical protein